MRSAGHSFSYWAILTGAFAGAAAFLCFAAVLFLQIFSGHGSHAGNFLRFALAVVSLLVGVFCLTVGALYRMSFGHAQHNEFE